MSLSLQDLEEMKEARVSGFIAPLDELIKDAFDNFKEYVIIPQNLMYMYDVIELHYTHKGFRVEFDTCVLDYIITGW